MTDTIIPTLNATDWTYSTSRGDIYYATPDGLLHVVDVRSNSEISRLQIDGAPGAVAVSPDGNFLLVGDTGQHVATPPGATQPTYFASVTRVNLTTQAIDTIQIPLAENYERGVYDLSVDADGAALVSMRSQGSGPTRFWTFPVAAATPTVSAVPSYRSDGAGRLISSETGRFIVAEEGNSSPASQLLFNSSSGQFTFSSDPYSFGDPGGSANRRGAVSEAAGLYVDVTFNNIHVFDLHLKAIANLSSYATDGGANNPFGFPTGGVVADAAFTKDGRELLLWEGGDAKVLVLDTTSWGVIGVIAVDRAISGFDNAAKMQLIGDGQTLALGASGKIELVSLANQLPGTGQVISAQANQSLLAGSGDDTISGSDAGANDIRGYYGNDSIQGGSQYNLINGNQGADTIVGHSTVGDSILGGQGNDLIDLVGSRAHNDVNGNIGSDTIHGGSGGDTLRGGQGDDLVVGGSGADWISGDRGNDTLTSGGGGDTFHMALGYGSDQVTDFNYAEGDRVIVDHGAIYTLSMSGADTLVDLGGGDRMLLKNITLSSLPTGWITQT